ncbi:anti-sigma factor [Microbacterium oryzae]|uniref:anti-sigma factor n=1 Tax=Microbacterium oryzae TaxID=743009 RepID=UPI0025B12B2C|nr:anti-sigma factor [Microbacterium oryzae]MDN3310951.1 anti-sigma factor [Microbacterium oryzae]
MTEKDVDELLAARALHALSPEDAARLDAALAADPALRDRADRDEETAALLADATPEVVPPAHLRAALLARIAEQPQVADGPGPAGADPAASQAPVPNAPAHASASLAAPANGRPAAEPAPSARVGRRRWFTLAASIAGLAVVGVGAVTISQLRSESDAVVAFEQIAEADDAQVLAGELPGGGTLEMHWSHSLGEVVVLADEAPELDDGRQYELWLVRGDQPIPAGVFDGGEDEPTLLEGELAPGDVVAVTIEQEGGSPTGLPTGDPIAAMPTD